MHITSEPLCSDPCARLKIQMPMHSISWGCPKIVCLCDPVSLLINTFGIHLEPGCKSHEQIIHHRTAKYMQKQATVLLYFRTNSYQLTRKGFAVVWPVWTNTTEDLRVWEQITTRVLQRKGFVIATFIYSHSTMCGLTRQKTLESENKIRHVYYKEKGSWSLCLYIHTAPCVD